MINQLKNKKEKYVKVCPKCGSTDAQLDFSNPVVWAYGTNVKYKCSSCGYFGTIFPEVLENELKHYKEELKQEIKEGRIKTYKKDFIDSSIGFSVGVYELIVIIIGLIFTIIISFLEDKESIVPLILWLILIGYIVWVAVKKIGNKLNLN